MRLLPRRAAEVRERGRIGPVHELERLPQLQDGLVGLGQHRVVGCDRVAQCCMRCDRGLSGVDARLQETHEGGAQVSLASERQRGRGEVLENAGDELLIVGNLLGFVLCRHDVFLLSERPPGGAPAASPSSLSPGLWSGFRNSLHRDVVFFAQD